MGDRRAERSRRRSLRVGVDPLEIIGRRRKRVDPLLRHLEPRGRPQLDADKAVERAHATIRPPARMRASDVSLPRSSRLSYRPGETRDPVTATRIGRYTVRGFSPSSSQSRFRVVSISAAVHGAVSLNAVSAAARTRASRSASSGSTSWKRNPANDGNSSSRAIFSCTSGPQPGREPRPSRSPAHEGVRANARRTPRREAHGDRARSSSRASRSRTSRGSSRRAPA